MATFPITQKIGSPTELITSKGAYKAEVGGIITTYSSTGAADANPYISTYPGAMIVTSADLVYFRNQAASAWVQFGTVTSVALSLNALFTVSGSPVTTSGTLTGTLSNQAIGTVLNNNSGSATAPVFTAGLVLGETGTTAGTIMLRSATAGGVPTIQTVGSSGNYNFNMPLSSGTVGQALLSGGGGTSPHTYGTVLTAITADNGLTASTSTNVQLGGTLIKHTTIAAGSFFLHISTSTAGAQPFQVTAGTGRAAIIQNTSASNHALLVSNNDAYTALQLFSAGGTMISGNTSGSGLGIDISTAEGVVGRFTNGTSAANTVATVLEVIRGATGNGASGIGGSIDFYSKSTTGTIRLTNQIISKLSTATDASRVSQLILTGVNNASTADLFTLSGSGSTRLNKYGVGTFIGTATYALQVDASGNIIEGTPAAANVASGIYTPTLTNAANVTSSTAYACQWLRVGNTVTVSGKIGVTFTTINAATRLGISLPLATAFAAPENVGGAAASDGGQSGAAFAIRADAINNRAEFFATGIGTGATEQYWFTFTYYIPLA